MNRLVSITPPNGGVTSYTYDSLSRLLSVLHQVGANTLDGAAYTVDAAGNRLSKSDAASAVTSNYTYDAIYQLTQVVASGTPPTTTEGYTFDGVGNRLSSLGVCPYSYNSSVVSQFARGSGEFTSPRGGIKPPLHQTETLPIRRIT